MGGISVETWEKIVDALQVSSILAAAAFAAMGLFTEYRRDGKITKYGRIAVAGIVLSAIFSLSTQWGKDEIDRAKDEAEKVRQRERETAEADARNLDFDRYRQQMKGLNDVAEDLKEVQTKTSNLYNGMSESLIKQERLQGIASRNLLATTFVRRQANENTSRVLASVWQEANRVDVSDVSLTIYIECEPVGSSELPAVLGNGAIATVTLRPNHRFLSDEPVFGHVMTGSASAWEQPTELKDASQIMSAEGRFFPLPRPRNSAAPASSQLIKFSAFTTRYTWNHSRFADWRDAAIKVDVTNDDTAWAAKIATMIKTAPPPPDGERVEWQHRIGISPTLSVSPKMCNARAQVMVGGRLLVMTGGTLAILRSRGGRPILSLGFSNAGVYPAALPALLSEGVR